MGKTIRNEQPDGWNGSHGAWTTQQTCLMLKSSSVLDLT